MGVERHVKLFKNGRSQAVRIPREFELPGEDAIIRKEGLGTDPVVQTHEDALCLVFLETQLAVTVDDLGDEKMLDVIRKTAAKMSEHALGLVGDLPMRPADRALIGRALEGT